MSPEERARSIVRGDFPSMQWEEDYDELEATLAAAFRAAENDLIDRAIRQMFAIGEEHGIAGAGFFAGAVLGPMRHKGTSRG